MSQPTNEIRIIEIIQLSAAEGLPLALRPETICALEDIGVLADPFTGQLWPDPAAFPAIRWNALCSLLPELLS